MDIKELRLGNFVRIAGQTLPLNENRFKRVLSSFYECEPIPLDEEWLLKFGFEKNKQTTPYNYCLNRQYKLFRLQYAKRMNFETGAITEGFNGLHIHGKWWDGISTVHRLQNIFFALTGEELTVKE